MIKLPKEVNKLMKTLQDEGFEAFATGACVRESLLGGAPYGWDIATSANFTTLKKLFPEAKVVSEKHGILRFEYIDEILDEAGEEVGEEGLIIDVASYRGGTIEDELRRKVFTIDAIADSPSKTVDVADGRQDLKKRMIRTVGEAAELFRAEPIAMIRAIRLAAELDFDLHKDVFTAIKENYKLLEQVEMKRVGEEFTMLLTGKAGGRGLSMVMDSGMINVILTEPVVSGLTKREMSDLTTLCQNIDKSYQVEDRRLGLFYTCLNKKKAMISIEKLKFEGDTLQHLIDAVNDMAKLYFTVQKPDLKKFIYKHGWERYFYLANLEKAQRIVFAYDSETKIRSKMYMLDEIKMYKEPIFPEELVIDVNDLLEAGICTDAEDAENMLCMLVEECHLRPKRNTRKELLPLAKKYKKNKLAAAMRGIHWYR